jgi:site-specific recombinase XerD
VDPDYTATVGLDRDQARALVADADADTGTQALRTAAMVRLLLHDALRVDEACAADVADLGEDCSHRVLRVVRKGARKAKVPLTRPRAVAALEACLAARTERAGAREWRRLSTTGFVPHIASRAAGLARRPAARSSPQPPWPGRIKGPFLIRLGDLATALAWAYAYRPWPMAGSLAYGI